MKWPPQGAAETSRAKASRGDAMLTMCNDYLTIPGGKKTIVTTHKCTESSSCHKVRANERH